MPTQKTIYLDYAGTTPLDTRVGRAVSDCQKTVFGNASSLHHIGLKARQLIDDSRRLVSSVLNCRPEEVIFTGSGTESDNLAIWGIAQSYKKYGRHIVTTKIEHPAILRVCEYLEKNGFEIQYLEVGKNGIVSPEFVKNALRTDTILVSVMYANNEIGTIQPIKEIAGVIKDFRKNQLGNKTLFFHSDACQAAGAMSLNVHELGVDLLTLNGSKIYGPKGTGVLFVRRGTELTPQIVGGGQERGLRAGTENPAMIAGFAEALKIADKDKEKESARLIKLRDYTIGAILKNVSGSRLNGDSKLRLPNNINISFSGVDGEMLMLALDKYGICISTGSACSADQTGPSHVMKAIGNPAGWGNIRLTLGRQTTKKDIDFVLKTLPATVKKLRN